MKQNLLKSHSLAAALAVAAVASLKAADVVSATANSPAATNPVTLDELVKEAAEQNPELRFYDAEIQAAKAGRASAGLLANPELSAGVGQKTVRGAGLSA